MQPAHDKPSSFAQSRKRSGLLAGVALLALLGLSAEARAQSLGIKPGTVVFGDVGLASGAATPDIEAAAGDWEFDYHGFLRVPLRLGLGTGEARGAEAPGGLELHTLPYIPDGDFTDWRYTNSVSGSWVEMRLSYGNERVAAHLIVDSYLPSDAAFTSVNAQRGIDQAFLTFNLPDFFGSRGGATFNVGAFQNRYGAAGRYDAGKYETYLFGRTHMAGETGNFYLRLRPGMTLSLEHGIGAKMELPSFLPPVEEVENEADTRLQGFSNSAPYGGLAEMLPTMVHHAHLGLNVDDQFFLTAHHLYAWTDGADNRTALPGDAYPMVDGSIGVYGAEAKMVDHPFGDAFVGYARMDLDHAVRVGGALEALHSLAGWNLANNYFGQPGWENAWTDSFYSAGLQPPRPTATGHIDTVLFQYTFSVARFLLDPKPYWGQSRDLQLSVFGMYNQVTADEQSVESPILGDPDVLAFYDLNGDSDEDGVRSMMKTGLDLLYTPFAWLGASVRYDFVQPDLDDKFHSFHVVSPRIFLRTEYASHEQVTIQYARYLNGDGVKGVFPNENRVLDKDVFQIAGVMWW